MNEWVGGLDGHQFMVGQPTSARSGSPGLGKKTVPRWTGRHCMEGQNVAEGTNFRVRTSLAQGKPPKVVRARRPEAATFFGRRLGRWSCSTSTTTRPPDHSQHRPWTRPRPKPRRRPPPHRSISPTGHGSSTHHHRPSCRSAGRRPPSSSSRKVSELPHRPRGRPPDEAKAA